MKRQCFLRGFAYILCLALLFPVFTSMSSFAVESDVVPVVVGHTKGRTVTFSKAISAWEVAGKPVRFSVSFTPGAKRIQDGAFDFSAAQKGLVSVRVSDSITLIGSWDGDDDPDTQSTGAFEGCVALRKVVLGENVKRIGSMAFFNCKNLSSINFPARLRVISDLVFSGCERLQKVSLPVHLQTLSYGAFAGCKRLRSIKLPASLKTIDGAFYNSGLRSIEIPPFLPWIGEEMFSGCKSLENVTIPNTIDWVGGRAFAGCTALKIVRVFAGSIDYDAFKGCKNLKTVHIFSEVEGIHPTAFQKCKKKLNVIFHGRFYPQIDRDGTGRFGFGDLFDKAMRATVTVPKGDETWDIYEKNKHIGVANVKRKKMKQLSTAPLEIELPNLVISDAFVTETSVQNARKNGGRSTVVYC